MSNFKIFSLFVVVATLAVAVLAGHHEGHHDYYSPPHYSYEYKVHDGHTGDMKSQHESREGDVVKGYYTLKEADGTMREVHYTADKHNGFNAEVKRIGHAVHAPVYGHQGGHDGGAGSFSGSSSGSSYDDSDNNDHHDYYSPPHYSYEYKVHDGHTGDVKSQHESREGDVVKGYYTLKEADGTMREVHYTADKHNGFNAEVKRIGHAVHAPVYGHHHY